jgi:Flp pilus assembly protein TadG
MKPLTNHRSGTRGVAAVEFGILLMPLLMVIFGATELGRAIYTYNTLDKTIRDAARHLSQHSPGDANIATQARCLAVHGNTACTGPTLAPDLSTSDIDICDALSCPGTHANWSYGLGTMNLVTVSIEGYSFNSVVEFVIPSLNFNNISTTMRGQL